jgi:hypothetical protein
VRAYRDLNEPEGCAFSSLRKILLLRFRICISKKVVYIGAWQKGSNAQWGKEDRRGEVL